MLGGKTAIQSITRAISSLQRKGLLAKGKLRSKSRFVLIHRPIEVAKDATKHAKQFLRRFTPKNLASLSATKPSRSKTKPSRQHKKTNQVEKSKYYYEERGEQVWYKLAPCGDSNDEFQISKITDTEKQDFLDWVRAADTDLKNWILNEYETQMEVLK